MTDFDCYVQVSDGFPKKVRMVGGWGELYPVLFWIFGIRLTLQSPFNLLDPEFLRASNICLDRSSYNGPCNKNG